MGRLIDASAGLVVWVAVAVIAVETIMALLAAGDYVLAALGFAVALGALATCAVASLVPALKD